jgi:prepilin-type N-terminal cleavage/methylation domain-containing protein/prepilin-type processing-associated H-X9-DG protein
VKSSSQTAIKNRSGFTLVEILVSLGLVLVLALFLTATLGKMRTKASLSQSVSNLHQVGVALLQYAADHEMELPNKKEAHKPTCVSRQLMDPYLHYLDKAWICPVIKSLRQPGVAKNDQGRFIYNWRLTNFTDGWRDNVSGIRLTTIQRPTEALLAANLSSGMRGGYGDGYANVLFADGGVRRIEDRSHSGGDVASMDCVNRNYLRTSGGKIRGYDY